MKSWTAFALAITLMACKATYASTFLYVSLKGEEAIAIYRFDEQSGKLTRTGEIAVTGEPGAMTTNPNRSRLYAAIRSRGELASFNINAKTGELTPINVVTTAADPAHLITDQSGAFLLSAYYVAGKVAVHSIHADGSISEQGRWYVTDDKAHAVAIDDQNRWTFVPHTGPNAIFQFEFDPTSGRLTPNTPNKLSSDANTGPRHFAFHPTQDYAYSDNEQGSSVTVFHFDRTNGQLEPIETLSTLPKDFNQPNTCARMEVTPNGRFLYAANRGHDSIAGFRIDDKDGSITRIGIFPTEQTPRSLNVDPTGHFLVAAGQDSNQLAVYRIATTGTLNRLATVPVGKTPWWVMFVRP